MSPKQWGQREVVPWPLSRKSVMKWALHGDHISPGGTEPITGAITRREEPMGLLSSMQRCESSCGMLSTWPEMGAVSEP